MSSAPAKENIVEQILPLVDEFYLKYNSVERRNELDAFLRDFQQQTGRFAADLPAIAHLLTATINCLVYNETLSEATVCYLLQCVQHWLFATKGTSLLAQDTGSTQYIKRMLLSLLSRSDKFTGVCGRLLYNAIAELAVFDVDTVVNILHQKHNLDNISVLGLLDIITARLSQQNALTLVSRIKWMEFCRQQVQLIAESVNSYLHAHHDHAQSIVILSHNKAVIRALCQCLANNEQLISSEVMFAKEETQISAVGLVFLNIPHLILLNAEKTAGDDKDSMNTLFHYLLDCTNCFISSKAIRSSNKVRLGPLVSHTQQLITAISNAAENYPRSRRMICDPKTMSFCASAFKLQSLSMINDKVANAAFLQLMCAIAQKSESPSCLANCFRNFWMETVLSEEFCDGETLCTAEESQILVTILEYGIGTCLLQSASHQWTEICEQSLDFGYVNQSTAFDETAQQQEIESWHEYSKLIAVFASRVCSRLGKAHRSTIDNTLHSLLHDRLLQYTKQSTTTASTNSFAHLELCAIINIVTELAPQEFILQDQTGCERSMQMLHWISEYLSNVPSAISREKDALICCSLLWCACAYGNWLCTFYQYTQSTGQANDLCSTLIGQLLAITVRFVLEGSHYGLVMNASQLLSVLLTLVHPHAFVLHSQPLQRLVTFLCEADQAAVQEHYRTLSAQPPNDDNNNNGGPSPKQPINIPSQLYATLILYVSTPWPSDQDQMRVECSMLQKRLIEVACKQIHSCLSVVHNVTTLDVSSQANWLQALQLEGQTVTELCLQMRNQPVKSCRLLYDCLSHQTHIIIHEVLPRILLTVSQVHIPAIQQNEACVERTLHLLEQLVASFGTLFASEDLSTLIQHLCAALYTNGDESLAVQGSLSFSCLQSLLNVMHTIVTTNDKTYNAHVPAVAHMLIRMHALIQKHQSHVDYAELMCKWLSVVSVMLQTRWTYFEPAGTTKRLIKDNFLLQRDRQRAKENSSMTWDANNINPETDATNKEQRKSEAVRMFHEFFSLIGGQLQPGAEVQILRQALSELESLNLIRLLFSRTEFIKWHGAVYVVGLLSLLLMDSQYASSADELLDVLYPLLHDVFNTETTLAMTIHTQCEQLLTSHIGASAHLHQTKELISNVLKAHDSRSELQQSINTLKTCICF